MTPKCPVCWRTYKHQITRFPKHRDKAGRFCPGSGEQTHINQEEM